MIGMFMLLSVRVSSADQSAGNEFGFPVGKKLALIADQVQGALHHPTLMVSNGTISGHLWCNAAAFEIMLLSRTQLSAPKSMMTLIDCGPATTADDAIIKILADCHWSKEGRELVLKTSYGRLRFRIVQ
ncbi:MULTISPECIES: hypothetical protein [unclassified Bradyrhizobium]